MTQDWIAKRASASPKDQVLKKKIAEELMLIMPLPTRLRTEPRKYFRSNGIARQISAEEIVNLLHQIEVMTVPEKLHHRPKRRAIGSTTEILRAY